MSLLLIRHAFAGDSAQWEGDDRLRPLDERGRRQAAALVDELSDFELDIVVSSPYVRCVQTVEPLAQACGVAIELDEQLGADRMDELAGVLARLRGRKAAICTHGDLPWLGDRKFKKGSVWVLNEELEPVRYLPPTG